MFDGVPRFSNIDNYTKIVKGKATLRRLITASNQIMAMAFDDEEEPEEILDQAERMILSIAEDRIKPRLERVPGISEVNVLGGREREVQVRIDPVLLARHGVTVGRFVEALRRTNRNVSAGTVAEALDFFQNVPSIRNKLQTLNDVGLGYIKLGQPATQLSGGEAQRVKLASELSRRATGRTLYILDAPTTGLHFEDVRKLLEVLHALVDAGNSVVVIEHNMEVIKTADWIIDLGPEGGEGGGRIVAAGTPEEVTRVEASHTGRYLKLALGEKSIKNPSIAVA